MIEQGFDPKSFWMTTQAYKPSKPLQKDIYVDVAIVGGGFTGLSSAFHLKKSEPEIKIALLESQIIGYGASGRNAGFNMTLFGLTMSFTAIRFGRTKAREAHIYMERAVDTLHSLINGLKINCDYEHPGFLRVATSEKYKKRILHEIELVNSLGIKGIEWINKEKLSEQVKSPNYLGAWLEPRCGLLNPAKLSWGWKSIIESIGVHVFENTSVIEISKDRDKLCLTTSNGKVYADKIVLATNAYSHLIPELKQKQVPVWTYIVLTEPLNQKHFAEICWKNRQGIEDARNLVHYYRLTADNRILMGGRDVSFAYDLDTNLDINSDTFNLLEKDVLQTFPILKGIKFTHRWGGPVSVPVDLAPAMGYLGDKRVVYSLGCLGHGVSLTHLNGCTVSDLILDRKTDLTDVFFVNRKTIPWPPNPIRHLAAQAILGYMHLEDKIFDPKE
ncbi:MAG: FAD-dependent oxidoreductase [Desulfobacterales bacterium]|nr:FAD-dependent oxidoreductase [Desulfobacterales bacterium]